MSYSITVSKIEAWGELHICERQGTNAFFEFVFGKFNTVAEAESYDRTHGESPLELTHFGARGATLEEFRDAQTGQIDRDALLKFLLSAELEARHVSGEKPDVYGAGVARQKMDTLQFDDAPEVFSVARMVEPEKVEPEKTQVVNDRGVVKGE